MASSGSRPPELVWRREYHRCNRQNLVYFTRVLRRSLGLFGISKFCILKGMLYMMLFSRHVLSLQTGLHRQFIPGTVILPTPSIHVSHCLEDFSPQTSPSGIIYPMVGVPSMCPPHQFSQFPTSGHLCRPAFLPTWPLHGLHTTLHTLLCTSTHLHAPLHFTFPGLVTLICPPIVLRPLWLPWAT